MPPRDPYASEGTESRPRSLFESLAGFSLPTEPVKDRKTERGELLRYFSSKLHLPIPRVVGKLGPGLSVEDLYYIKSAADSYERDGNPWGKAFYGMLKPRDQSAAHDSASGS